MFSAQNFEEIAEEPDYVSEDIARILSTAQHLSMIKEVTEEIKRKKEAFLRNKEKEASKLRDNLHKLFTSILIRRTKTELLDVRRVAEHRIDELAAEHEERLHYGE